MEGDLALHLLVFAGHLRAAQPAANINLYALSPALHGALGRLLHGAAVGHAALELVGHVAGNEPGIKLRHVDLDDVDAHLLVGDLLQLLAQVLHVLALAADNYPGSRRLDGHRELISVPIDVDSRDPRVANRFNAVADLQVLLHKLDVRAALGCVPLAVPVLDDSDAETDGMNLLAHYSSSWSTTMVTWAKRRVRRATRPLDRAR